MFFFVITKNLNWKILTKNLVACKRWDGVKDEKLNIMLVHWKIWFLGRRGRGGGGGGLQKKQYIGGKGLKRGEGLVSFLS